MEILRGRCPHPASGIKLDISGNTANADGIRLGLFLIVLGNHLFNGLMYFIPQLGVFQSLFGYGKYLCMLVLLMVFFLTVYMTVPNRKSKLRYELLGALFSTVAWLVFSWAFSFYIGHYANYSVTYGSLAAIVIFILWLYGTMNIVLSVQRSML
ncbi:YihY/virulence factor BrkB family protein, partial [Lachnospiraceae bacterium MD335]|nr:YihY/virulence factor BrkB family protein [Lachnospiraceae bacterium MD335]